MTLLILIAIVVAGLVLGSVRIVKPGSVMLVERLGVERRTLPAGVHLLVPVVDATVAVFPESSIQSVNVAVDTATSDGQRMRCSGTVRIAGAATTAVEIDAFVGETVRAALAAHTSTAVRANTDLQLERYLRSELQTPLATLGLQVVDVRLWSITRP